MKASILLVCLSAMLFLPSHSSAQDDTFSFLAQSEDKKTLAGLKSFGVQIDLDSDASSLGITERNLEHDVETQVRRSGVTVLNAAEVLFEVGHPNLRVSLIIMPIEVRFGTPTGYAYSWQVAFEQQVYLVRDNNIRHPRGQTWQHSGVGMSPVNGATTVILHTITDAVNEFLLAYLAANPRN